MLTLRNSLLGCLFSITVPTLVWSASIQAEIVYDAPFLESRPELADIAVLPMTVVDIKEDDGGVRLEYEIPLDLTGGVRRKFTLVSSTFADSNGAFGMTSEIPGETSAGCSMKADGLSCSMDYGTSLSGTVGTPEQVREFLQAQVTDPTLLQKKIDLAKGFVSEGRGVIRGLTLPTAPAVTGCQPKVSKPFCSFRSLPKSKYMQIGFPENNRWLFQIFAPQSMILGRVFERPFMSQPCLAGSLIVDTVWQDGEINNGDLSYSNIPRNQMLRSRFYNMEARSANFAGVQFEDSSFRDSCLADSNWEGSTFTGDVSFAGSDLRSASLKNVRIEGTVDWTGAKLGGATWFDGRTCAANSVGECK